MAQDDELASKYHLASESERDGELVELIPTTDKAILHRNYSKLKEPEVALEVVLSELEKEVKDASELDVLRVKIHTKVARNLAEAGHAFSKEQMSKFYELTVTGAELIERKSYDFRRGIEAVNKMHYHFYSHAANWARDLADVIKKDAKGRGLSEAEKAECVLRLEQAVHCEDRSADLCNLLDPMFAVGAWQRARKDAKKLHKLTGCEEYRSAEIKFNVLVAGLLAGTDDVGSSKAYSRAARRIRIPKVKDDKIEDLDSQEFSKLETSLLDKAEYYTKSGDLVEETDVSCAAHRFVSAAGHLDRLRHVRWRRKLPIDEVLRRAIHLRGRAARLYSSTNDGVNAGAQYAKAAQTRIMLGRLMDVKQEEYKHLIASCYTFREAVNSYGMDAHPRLAAKCMVGFGSAAALASEISLDDKLAREAVNLASQAYTWSIHEAERLSSNRVHHKFNHYANAVIAAKAINNLCAAPLKKIWRGKLLFACDELLRTYKLLPRVSNSLTKTRDKALDIKRRFEKPVDSEPEKEEPEKEMLVFGCPECGAEVSEDAAECPGCDVGFEADVFDELDY